MTKTGKSYTGQWGERVAAWYLSKKGYKIKHRHYTSRFGEVDLIVEKEGCLVFVEVKTRLGDNYGWPEQAVNYYKMKKLKRVIFAYLSRNNTVNWQIDVLAIVRYQARGKVVIRHHQSVSNSGGKSWF